MRKLLSVLLIVVAVVNVGWRDEPEVKFGSEVEIVYEYPLQVTCPECGFILYYVSVPEFFDGDIVNPDWFIAADKRVTPYTWTDLSAECPICKRTTHFRAVRKVNSAPNNIASEIHTNKGWMPRRERPKY